MKGQGIQADLLVEAHDAKKDASALLGGQLVGLLDNLGVSRPLNHNFNLGSSNDVAKGVLQDDLARIYAVSSPMSFRKLELVVEQVDGNDGMGARKLGSKNGPKPDASDSDDADRLTDPYICIV